MSVINDALSIYSRASSSVTFAQGNDGMSISETDVDSLGLVSLSYGNQGLNPDLVVESACISSNGTVDCTGETVQVQNADALQGGVQALATVAFRRQDCNGGVVTCCCYYCRH